MSARHLILGLDGADPDLITTFGRDQLPNLFRLIDRGVFARLESVKPCATLPNWSTFLTATDPGVHGVFDFTSRTGYSVAFTGGTVRTIPTILSRLDAMGRVCACIGFPATWPPERLKHGAFVSGWDSPVAFEGDSSFVWPTSLFHDMKERFGALRFDDVDEFDANREGWHQELPLALAERIAKKVELGEWLLDSREWDVFALYFGESDTAAHYLWSLHDAASPRHPREASRETQGGLLRVYQALDRAVAALVARAGGTDVEITLVSDHGSGGSSDKVLHINRVLEDAGLLAFRPSESVFSTSRLTRALKEAALTQLPPKARELAFRVLSNALPGWLESRARFSAIDMERTLVFSEELNYFPSVHLNLEGREPLGKVSLRDRDAVIARTSEALLSLRDAWTDLPVVKHVHRREDLYRGPHVSRAPDLILELHLDRGYSYNVMPSTPDSPVMRRIPEIEWLGRKGRSLPGSHRSHGIYIAAGKSIRPGISTHPTMADASITTLHRMNVAPTSEMSGRVLTEILLEAVTTTPLAESVAQTLDASAQDAAKVESRLRALGYID